MSARVRWAGRAAIVLASLGIGFALLELAASVLAARQRADRLRRPDGELFIVADEELGWRPTPDRELGSPRAYRSDARGWRRFETDGEAPLVVIGDSFTQAAGVPDGEVYYDWLAAELGLPVVALGVNGYGTTQQWLLARELRPELPRARALLLQLHDNDLVNNSRELERRSWLNNNMLPRPYLGPDGEVERGDPRRWFERFVLGRQLSRRMLTGRAATVEAAIEDRDPSVEAAYAAALDATAESLARLRALFADVPAYAFDACPVRGRMAGDLERLADEAGFQVLSVHPELDRRGAGAFLLLEDGAHWNERGHALVGALLAEQLRDALR